MSRGSNMNNGKLFFLNIKGMKAGEKVHFKQVEAPAVKGNALIDHPDVGDVSGQLHKTETVMYTYEGISKPNLVIWLKDLQADEMVRVSCGLNSVGRSIINSLASIEGNIGKLAFSVYNSKKTGRPSVTVHHNDQKIGWKYTSDELKKYIKKSTKKERSADGKSTIDVDVYDYFDLDEFLLGLWNGPIREKVQNLSTAPVENTSNPYQTTEGPKDDNTFEPNSDDLPF